MRLAVVCIACALVAAFTTVTLASDSSHDKAPAAASHAPAPAHPAPAATAAPKPTAEAPKEAAPAAKPAEPHAAATPSPLTADQILSMMKDGNKHFLAGKLDTPNTGASRRTDTAANGQKPVATVISCSDSRVPVELLFDRGIGDLFVIRVAGNVCDTDEIGSAEYGVDHLGTPVLLVLGHTKCGAVTAVVSGAELHGHIAPLVDNIKPALEAARHAHPNYVGDDLLAETIKANVFQSIEDLLTKSDMIRERTKSGKVRVEGAIYDITAGSIEWIGPHPRQQSLLEAPAAPADAHTTSNAQPAHAEQVLGEHPAPPAGAARSSGPIMTPDNAAAHVEAAPAASAHAPAATQPAYQPTREAAPRTGALPSLLERCMGEELYQQGVRALDAGDYALASEKFRAAGQLDPSMLAARCDLAGVLYLQQKYAESLEIYKSILTADARYANALRGAALCQASLKQYDDARTTLRKLLDLDRRDAQTWLDAGDVSFLAGDTRAARENWEAASRLSSASPEVVKQAKLRLNTYGAASAAPAAESD
jgi:carbonic anhydrase